MKLHQIPGYIQTIYLVEYPHGMMLLDGCSRADVSTLRRYFYNTLKRPMSDLKIIVVTHMHPDHAGAAAKLRKITGCRIVSAHRPRHWYSGIDGRLMHLSDLILTYWVAGRIGKPRKNLWYSPSLHPDIAVKDGDTIPGFEEWQVLETPGHTDRDLSVLHTPTHKVYVADLLVKVKNRFIPPFPVFHPNKYRASVQRLKDLSPAAVWLAHGGEIQLSDADYVHLLHKSPNKPKTHWRATKAKIRQLFINQRASE